jgi:UDP-N-acetylglucosamine transferase subunit ALG13
MASARHARRPEVLGFSAVIFVTIGSLVPFDRLIRVMDGIAAAMKEETFFAQIGDGTYEPKNMPFARLLPRREFVAKVTDCRLIVAHAGIGSVISAMEIGRPIVLLPRIFERGEHTTNHQMATARWLQDRAGIHVCMDDSKLEAIIKSAISSGAIGETMPRSAPEGFVNKIRDYIASA